MKVLLVTNDWPPRVGGIQTYLWNVYRRLPSHGIDVRVLAPAFDGDRAFDAASPYETVRRDRSIWWSSRDLRAQVRDLARDADAVVLGAVLPMNLAARGLRAPLVVHTYGFEVAWARLPGARALLRAIGREAALVTTLSDYTGAILRRALGDVTRVEKLPTGVELDVFTPEVDGKGMRARLGLDDRPVCVCVSRLVPRKGQDTLIEAWPAVRARVPDATLLIVGGGPYRARLERTVSERGLAGSVVFAGEVPYGELPACYAAGDVFAMPCRDRFAGLEVEGLGIVYLEAQACARPAITGDSGGAPEAVVAGETGLVVRGGDARALADAVGSLLGDPDRARAMGTAGRAFVERAFRWDSIVSGYADTLRALA